MTSKRRKKSIIIAVSLSSIVILWIVLRATGILQYYSIPTYANSPTLKAGSIFFTSTLKSPERFDFICFNYTDSMYGKEATYVFRLCGLPGDTLELRSGTLYVNGRFVDNELNVKYRYSFPTQFEGQVLEFAELDEEELLYHYMNLGDSCVANLDKSVLQKLKEAKIPYHRFIREGANEAIQNLYKQPWSEDQFGPYIVPAGHYFVLGDNRYAAQDSRYIGPVPMEKLITTVLNP